MTTKASPELIQHLDQMPTAELLGHFAVMTRHLARCLDPDGSVRPLDPDGIDMLAIVAKQVELVAGDGHTVRDGLVHHLARCTRQVIRTGCYAWVLGGFHEHRPTVKAWALAYGDLVAYDTAATAGL